MAKLFAKPVQNKTHREELHGFIFFVTTNSEGFFFFQIQVNGLMKMITCSRRYSAVLLVIFQKKKN